MGNTKKKKKVIKKLNDIVFLILRVRAATDQVPSLEDWLIRYSNTKTFLMLLRPFFVSYTYVCMYDLRYDYCFPISLTFYHDHESFAFPIAICVVLRL